jgi:hypothetical protein
MARPTSPQATAMPAVAPVDSRDNCLGCEAAFESEPTEVADIADTADVEPKLVEAVDFKLEDIVLAAKIHLFI